MQQQQQQLFQQQNGPSRLVLLDIIERIPMAPSLDLLNPTLIHHLDDRSRHLMLSAIPLLQV